MGKVNKKSKPSKKENIYFKKQPTLWITISVITAVVIGVAAFTTDMWAPSKSAVSDKQNETEKLGTTEHRKPSNSANPTSKKYELTNQYFTILCNDIELGHSKEKIKEIRNIEYEHIISQGLEIIDFLKEQTKGEDITVRKKATAEWLMSDIIKQQTLNEEYHYTKKHGITALKHDCIGLTGPADVFDKWCDLKKGTIIQITGNLNLDWYTAKRVLPMANSVEGFENNILESEQVEFWINRNDFYYIYEDAPLTFNLTQVNDAEEYTHIIKDTIKKQYCPALDSYTECVNLYMTPDEQSGVVGYAYKNDLIRIKKDWGNNRDIITEVSWILIEKIPFYGDNSNIGWIKKEYITEVYEDMQPRQGFVLRNTKIFKEPSTDSLILNDIYPDIQNILSYNPVACVHIFDKIDNWFKIKTGLNSITGYVRKDDVYFIINDEIKQNIYNPEPDFDTFVSVLQSEIINSPSFTLKAEDTEDTVQLSTQQKISLANSITKITDYEMFDGLVADFREAAYPFYRLDFGTYSMVLTTEDQLLLLLDNNTAYNYGIGREGMPIVFVTPNNEFIQEIRELLPPPPNTSKHSLNYLMNSTGLVFGGDYFNSKKYTEQVRINKCVRSIKKAFGKEIPSDEVDHNTEDMAIFEFEFSDGNITKIIYTDTYIEYNERYYEPMMPPKHMMGSLLSAYF